jgi:U2-associated protein SR140
MVKHNGVNVDLSFISTRLFLFSFPSMIEFKGRQLPLDISKALKFQPGIHSSSAITVKAPADPDRFHFISTVASFIAIDGSQLERKLMEAEGNNPEYAFLKHDGSPEGRQREEHIFYRWRVYAFCQGDTLSNWRTEPFVMFHPNGRFWLPPPLDRKASGLEKGRDEEKCESRRREKDQRAEEAQERKEFFTGRQIERARGARRKKGNRQNMDWDVGMKLSIEDRDRFNWLVRKKLTISRESICSAMAFCFEKSGAAQQIAALLKDTLVDDAPHITVDMRIARLYLLSDILFNSQQPGVRNAFMYRDALEKMAPEIFTSLGRHGSGRIGRMTMNKLRNAVSTVIQAWTEWSVYNPAFLDELEARFSGREIKKESVEAANSVAVEAATPDAEKKPEEVAEVVITRARGDWTEVASEEEDEGSNSGHVSSHNGTSQSNQHEEFNQTHVSSKNELDSSAPYDDDLDGAPVDDAEVEDVAPSQKGEESYISDAHNAGRNTTNDDIYGVPVDEDIDGEPMDDDGVDGIPLEPQTDDVDGEALDSNDIDGEPIDDESIGGAPLEPQIDDVDGDVLDENDIDGEELKKDETITPNEAEDVDGESLEDGFDDDDIDGDALDD